MSVAIIVIILVVAIPVAVIMTGAIAAAILGWLLKSEIEERVRGHRVHRNGRLNQTPLGPPGPLISDRYRWGNGHAPAICRATCTPHWWSEPKRGT